MTPRLYHFTCAHRAADIQQRGELLPFWFPGHAPMVYLTSERGSSRRALWGHQAETLGKLEPGVCDPRGALFQALDSSGCVREDPGRPNPMPNHYVSRRAVPVQLLRQDENADDVTCRFSVPVTTTLHGFPINMPTELEAFKSHTMELQLWTVNASIQHHPPGCPQPVAIRLPGSSGMDDSLQCPHCGQTALIPLGPLS